MNAVADTAKGQPGAPAHLSFRGRLFRKYIGFFAAVVCVALIFNGAFEFWFFYRDYKALLVRLQHEQAESAAAKISQFFKEIESQIGWTTQLPWEANTVEDWRFDVVRLLRQVPAITELAKLDNSGREQLRVSRLAPDVIGSLDDRSREPAFIEARANKTYYGPVYFRRESEPYLALAMAGGRTDAGVTIAEVNLKFIWEVISQIKVGEQGHAYVVDAESRLIAHPDLSLVLRNTDLSRFAQVQAARASGPQAPPPEEFVAQDIRGRKVLASYAPIAPLGWLIFVELPVAEGYALMYEASLRSGALLLVALGLAGLAGLLLARRMIVPIQALSTGAARIGSGDLAQRISIRTGDELEALGDQFNRMAARLQDSYASLERKVEERTHDLELANEAKSRFLAAASHDLRQPLHALGLFVSQLRAHAAAPDARLLVERIDASVSAMNELFNALLDISRLDAGALQPDLSNFPVNRLLERIANTFAGPAHEKGLSLRIVPSSAWIRSDPILLERVLLNLVSNAVRYTSQGGIVIVCRRRAGMVRIDVCDTGPGIPEDRRRDIFAEFYQLPTPQRDQRGLGLGLSIVDRICRMLGHPIQLTSVLGRGSRFAVSVPVAASQVESVATPAATALPQARDVTSGKLIVVVDDDALALESISGLLRSWGCRVVSASTLDMAVTGLAEGAQAPDLIISDYRLSDSTTGIDVIERLRQAYSVPIPAFLISGSSSQRLQEAQIAGHHLLHKPVPPIRLRAMVNELLKNQRTAGRPN